MYPDILHLLLRNDFENALIRASGPHPKTWPGNLDRREATNRASELQSGNLEIVRYCLEHHPRKFITEAVCSAISSGDILTVKYLLQSGFPVSDQKYFLNFAVKMSTELTQLFLEEVTNLYPDTLINAASHGDEEIVQLLLPYPFAQHAIDRAFLAAVNAGHLSVVKLLRERANILSSSQIGYHTNWEIIQYIAPFVPRMSLIRMSEHVIKHNCIDSLILLLDLGIDLNMPLAYALLANNKEAISIILKRKVDLVKFVDYLVYHSGLAKPDVDRMLVQIQNF